MNLTETVLNNILNRMAINFRLEQRVHPYGSKQIDELKLMNLTADETAFLKSQESETVPVGQLKTGSLKTSESRNAIH